MAVASKERVRDTKPVNPRIKSFKEFFKRLRKNKSALVGFYVLAFLFLVSIFGAIDANYNLLGVNSNATSLTEKLEGPSAAHWFGTDHLGRDIFFRILHGMYITLGVGFAATFMGALVGVPLGILAGYYGGWLDTIIMRIMDVLLAFPGILLALAIVSVLGGSTINVTIAIAIGSLPQFARIVRGSTLTTKKLEYVDAIRALGARDGKIIFQHILPNIMSPIIVNTTLFIASAILSAAGLSFLGLGVQPPTPEWGAMLNDGRNYMYQAGHITFFPGMMIVIVVLAFNLFGDGLRDAIDPKQKN
ncbi:ABC transporter permease [Lacicoccus alkaliphilus]|uniref:Peptide/nickel transport system permease protein n=1 Tax=Lacicoccus alkaliphilus DSM 16010 TaxID=1123231 RepID=A0A1M7F2P2_9BACL|nr:ABC transporter permease [Salinicoccus alkaliphilus]SHL97947.1 peptide/nickel transport system permease protein [Salinicoccus alkaliphilus DSM 16010]